MWMANRIGSVLNSIETAILSRTRGALKCAGPAATRARRARRRQPTT
ncbi:enoyl-ACP reductase [Burkholderia thailandensis]|nr:enoyl-ACP reductase [Burkholderia thailandensis]AOJ54214.1 enoyl-ACP reductase [Burkholderia thailandensis]AOJ60109.1 enoyl-ACP reductase [Burkholderia thailandensis]AVR27629.1 enoyl-ACP reductase [Burkholderia thailandensis]AWY60676.1 enoyl-ACP reductase [Burkholderia thailandensis]